MMKSYGLPEREYLQLFLMIKKLDRQATAMQNTGKAVPKVRAQRLIKKAAALVARAKMLESILRIPEGKGWTKQYG